MIDIKDSYPPEFEAICDQCGIIVEVEGVFKYEPNPSERKDFVCDTCNIKE